MLTGGRRPSLAGQGWLLPTTGPVIALAALLALRHPRVIYTSDSAAQQSIVRTWLDVGHGTTSVPSDTWALKIPLYLVLEHLPLAALDKMLAAVLVLNTVTFLLLGWAAWRLAAGWGEGVRWYELAVPLAWLATLGGGIGSNRMLANYRNIELGLSFVVLAMVAGYLARPTPPTADDDGPRPRWRWRWRPIAVGGASAVLCAVLWYDDPYVEMLVGLPLLAAALLWYRLRERDVRLLHVAAVMAASYVITALFQHGSGLVGVTLDTAPALAVSPSDLRLHLSLLLPGTGLQLGVDGWASRPLDVLAQILVVAAFVVLVAACTALAGLGWRRRRFAVTFVALHWPLVVAGFLVSWASQNASAGRYLILAVCDVAVATVLLLPELRRLRPAAARALVALLAVSALVSLDTGAYAAIDADRRPSPALEHQQAVVDAVRQAVREHGAVKGYAPFWDGNIISYRAGEGTTTAEIVCRDGRLSTREWLSDTVRLTRPARAVFLIWDPQAVYLSGCSAAIRDAQLGPPLVTYRMAPTVKPAPGGGVDSVLVYPADIEARLRP